MIRPLPLTLKAYPLATLFIINSECLRAFRGMFEGIPRNFWQNFLDGLATFLRIFGNIPRNVWWDSPECFATFPGMFENDPWNIWQHTVECLATFPGILGENLWNIWQQFPEYNANPIPRPLIPFPIPIFLILCIANLV